MRVTRRQWAKLGACALAVGSGRPGPAEESRLDLGVGTFSYHNLSIPDMVVQLKALGVKQVEMSHGSFMLMKPPARSAVEEARRSFDEGGIRCVSYYTATIKNAQDLDFALRNAKILGAKNVSGDATGPLLRDIDERFTKEGLTFGIHNHWFQQGFPYQSTDDVLRALAGRSNAVGATLDVGQMAACGNDPVDAVRRLAPYLKVVHLKDVAGAGAEHNVLFGQGIVPIRAVMNELKHIDFRGLVAIEYESEADVTEDMRRQWAYASKLV